MGDITFAAESQLPPELVELIRELGAGTCQGIKMTCVASGVEPFTFMVAFAAMANLAVDMSGGSISQEITVLQYTADQIQKRIDMLKQRVN